MKRLLAALAALLVVGAAALTVVGIWSFGEVQRHLFETAFVVGTLAALTAVAAFAAAHPPMEPPPTRDAKGRFVKQDKP